MLVIEYTHIGHDIYTTQFSAHNVEGVDNLKGLASGTIDTCRRTFLECTYSFCFRLVWNKKKMFATIPLRMKERSPRIYTASRTYIGGNEHKNQFQMCSNAKNSNVIY